MAALTENLSGYVLKNELLHFVAKPFKKKLLIYLGLWWCPSDLCLKITVGFGTCLPHCHISSCHRLTFARMDNFSSSFLNFQRHPLQASRYIITSTMMLSVKAMSFYDIALFVSRKWKQLLMPLSPPPSSQTAWLMSTAGTPAPLGCCCDVLRFLLHLPHPYSDSYQA